jgi:hypothetical protein
MQDARSVISRQDYFDEIDTLLSAEDTKANSNALHAIFHWSRRKGRDNRIFRFYATDCFLKY